MQDALFGAEEVGDPTWTVADLARAMGSVVEQAFPGEVWVRGEIRGLAPPGDARRSRPHLYFDLVEPTAPGQRPRAVLPVVLWSSDRKRVNDDLRRSGIRVSAMDSGVDVRIRGRVRWWSPGGRAQLQMTAIDPDYTLGRLAADRDAVLAALAADDLLDRNGRRTVPVLPTRVAVVTSVGSAAHADVHRVLGRAGLTHLVVDCDARTQGPAALVTVPEALTAAAAAGAELVLLVRGGGSRVELAAFDSEQVARAVASCPVPVFTGIGHEIDESVADRVAHTSCPTPSAAAAEVVALVAGARDRAEALWAGVAAGALRSLERRRAHLTGTARQGASLAGAALRAGEAQVAAAQARVGRAGPGALAAADRRLEARAEVVRRDARRDLGAAARRLDGARDRLARRPGPVLARRRAALDGLDARVRAADPALALARGWSITYRDDGAVVRAPGDVAPGDALETVVAGGRVRSTVVGGEPDGGGGGGAPDAADRPGSTHG
ncbi:exodeoxyribonuclease VII large subunit [Iamia majanohamensis]|uniref:Exodeoxyribonuclease 7 large subunit n=1 Tax=Iamia majanohamensis TaxID=467976 RepID=A0AAE9Y5R3_9ACTN|nr:exodeoxyribonuclease VII large subunit [Iamia majanohamensis]WCO67325.1 exodeoxyribonuclease VII large subunit [Iamia majanohamensis]